MGEFTRQLSNLIGPVGMIIVIDNNEKSLEAAQSKIDSFRFKSVQFIKSDVSRSTIDQDLVHKNSVDLLVGRRILMYFE